MRGIATSVVAAVLILACGGGDAAPGTTAAPTADDIAAYCAVLTGVQERGSEETMEMLEDVVLPAIADVMDRLMRRAGSQEDIVALGDFNDATCGIRFP